MMDKFRKMVCVDFDGVLHSYSSGWQGADLIPDKPVPGAMGWLKKLVQETPYDVGIFSARATQDRGAEAIKDWLYKELLKVCFSDDEAIEIADSIKILHHKPPEGFIFIDDRAFHFQGKFPSLGYLETFTPWGKK